MAIRNKITNFLTSLPQMGARPYLMAVSFSAPGVMDNAKEDVLQKIPYLCKSASIPESTISSFEIDYQGRKIKVPGNRSYADLTTTFYNDEDFGVREYFETWIAKMAGQYNVLGQSSNLIASDDSNVSTDVFVYQYSKDAATKILRSYQYVKCFPTSVSSIALGWDQGDGIETFDVTWAYQYWVIGGTGTADSGAGANIPAELKDTGTDAG